MDFPTAISAQIRSTISAPYFDGPFGLAIVPTLQCDEYITSAQTMVCASRFSKLGALPGLCIRMTRNPENLAACAGGVGA
jgi:hypothetical protein